jgi:hypothetical protein
MPASSTSNDRESASIVLKEGKRSIQDFMRAQVISLDAQIGVLARMLKPPLQFVPPGHLGLRGAALDGDLLGDI